MTKIAYLIGVSGSGKGYIAEQLRNDLQLITVDHLHHKAADRLCPDDIRPWYNWERWDEHLRDFDVSRTFSTILAESWPHLSNDRPLLAEAFILGHDCWRKEFQAALTHQGLTIDHEEVFWIDPSARILFHRRQERGRDDQCDESVETVQLHRDWYHERVNHDVVRWYEDTEETIRAIREFLLP